MFKVTTKQEAIKEVTNTSNFINKSGVYDVVIKHAYINVAKTGSESINFVVDYNGQEQTLYGPYYKNKEGETLEIGTNLYNKLAIIAGLDDGDELTLVENEIPLGKDQTLTEVSTIEEFEDLPVKVYVQQVFSKYEDNINEKQDIRTFYRAKDGATAEEIINDENFGNQLKVVMEKYADKVVYRDGLTEEDVKEWLNERYSKQQDTKKTPKPKRRSKTVFK